MNVLKMRDLDLAGKRLLIREDLNVPIKDGKVSSDARLRAALPTLKLALEKGAKVIVMSHLGRPTEGEFEEKYSMRPVADYLSDALGQPVPLVRPAPCMGEHSFEVFREELGMGEAEYQELVEAGVTGDMPPA